MIHDSVSADDIGAVIFCQTGIPITKLMSGEIEKLANMEDTLRFAIRGQNEALTTVANLVRSRRTGLSGDNRPIASFLMLGPTGVENAELSKKLASYIFLNQSAMIFFDMSEF